MQGVQPTLTNVEAQRVMAVVDDLVQDLQNAFVITPQVLAEHPEIIQTAPEPFRGALKQVQAIDEQLSHVASQLEEPVSEFIAEKDQPERSQLQEALALEYIEISRRLRKATREVCRLMKAHPEIGVHIYEAAGGEDQLQDTRLAHRFSRVLEQLRIQTLRNLGTSVEEDKAEKEHFEIVAQREKKLAQEAKSLSKDLQTIKHERNKTSAAKDAQIAAYRNDIKELKAMTAKAQATGGRKSEKNEAAVRAFNETKSSLLREVKKREAELERLRLENREKEDALSKRSFKKETDVEIWITKFDQEMSDLNIEILSTQAAYSDEKARLRQLEDYMERFRLQEGGQRLLQCCEIADDAEVAAKRNRLDTNATRIQSAIRGHLMRRDLIERAKKKGKGKKGKGKGKGKKK